MLQPVHDQVRPLFQPTVAFMSEAAAKESSGCQEALSSAGSNNLNVDIRWPPRRQSPLRQSSDHRVATLQGARAELRSDTAALLSAQESERQRIANELHDSIGQTVGNLRFGIALALEMVRAGDSLGAEEMLFGLGSQAKLAVDEVRRISMDLRPATLDDLGIVRTLSWFFREFGRVHPDLAIATVIAIEEIDVPAVLATAIYRVVQEACNNIVRHAQASAIQVTLKRLDGAIHLRIEDNGQGIVGADQRCPALNGLGLRSMRDRVEFLGGCFCLETELGCGTCIVANWPVAD
jgi:signal transduction histidine kinase